MENENKTYSKFYDKLVKIDTIGDGNCLIHSILKASYNEYQENPELLFRIRLARDIRLELAKTIITSDTRFPNEESVTTLVKEQFKVYKSQNFLEFLRIVYKYEAKHIQFPSEPCKYINKNGSYIDPIFYKKYIEEYKNYLFNIYEKLQAKSLDFISSPNLDTFLISEEEASNEIILEYDLIQKAYNELIQLIEYHIAKLKYDLEVKVGDYLYLPTKFNEGVIEQILNNNLEIPEGKYSYLPYNCYLFTCCKASNLMKLEWEYHDLEGITYLKDIPRYLESIEFIGDSDALSYIPELMGVNLIIMNFDNNKIINIYENIDNDKFVLIHNQNNRHFETVGFLYDSNIWTLFDRQHPIVTECLESIKREDKVLNFKMDYTKPKIINFMKDKIDRQKDVVMILRKTLADKVEIDYCNEFDSVAYIRYYQTEKTIYRFYIDEKGEVVSGVAPEKIKLIIKNILS